MRALLAWIETNATAEYRRNNPNGYLFCRPSDGRFPNSHYKVFGKVLADLGIRIDLVTGKVRDLYSLRHYYATRSLQDGVSITFLADNMGNSETMIRRHYYDVLTDLQSGKLTGSERTAERRRREYEQLARDPWDAADDVQTDT